MDKTLIPYTISALTVVLGFLALLSQRIYIDKETEQATQIKIPFLGRMKTNYPALIFVFVGIGLAVFVFSKSISLDRIALDKSLSQNKPKVNWQITGSLKGNGGQQIDWENGSFNLFPTDFTPQIIPNSNGKFIITAQIEEGKRFSDFIQRIDYTHPQGNAQIFPKQEYEHYKKAEDSQIKHITETSIEYKPVLLNSFNEPPPAPQPNPD